MNGFLACVAQSGHIGQFRLSFGQGAGLVHDQRIDLGHAFQRPEPGLQFAITVAVPVGLSPVATLVAASTNHAFDVVLHQRLEHGLCHGAQKIPLIVLLQQFDQVHVVLGHRGLHRFVVEACKLHHNRRPRWPPRLHRQRDVKVHHVRGRYLE